MTTPPVGVRSPTPEPERALYRVTCSSGNIHLVIAQSISGVVGEMTALKETTEGVERVAVAIGPTVFQLHSSTATVRLGYRAIDTILRVVAQFYRTPERDVRGKRRTRQLSRIRDVVAYLARTHTTYSFEEIGHMLGGRHHTSVMSMVRRTKERLEGDTVLQREVQDLTTNVLPIRPGEARR